MSSSGEEDPIQALSKSGLSIVVVGASGDLAKKKTYPSLLNLYLDELLPKNVKIWGYARSQMTDEELRDRLKPYLEKEMKNKDASKLDDFLSICHYQGGTSYGDVQAFEELEVAMEQFEATIEAVVEPPQKKNRLFYFAIPPNVFAETGLAIKKTCMQDEEKGWTRLIVEKVKNSVLCVVVLWIPTMIHFLIGF
jgi:glucose-6-phosphate 1-dehydrogenase